jgi:5'-methylthioadenosine phosphorylase/5'-methylthioinosine phosphorylase
MGRLAIVGGSGAARLEAPIGPGETALGPAETPFGPTSGPIRLASGGQVLYLPRHGEGHRIPPHRVNYRANLWALRELGAEWVVGLAAVGGIAPGFGPRVFAVPDQILDYTYGRDHSIHDGQAGATVVHIDFTEPYCADLREALLGACAAAGVPVEASATYGATQGPRLETAAEIARLERDGCHLVGMTGMPEAALARELGLCYASLAYVVNWAAGKGDGPIDMQEIEGHLDHCMGQVGRVLAALISAQAPPA